MPQIQSFGSPGGISPTHTSSIKRLTKAQPAKDNKIFIDLLLCLLITLGNTAIWKHRRLSKQVKISITISSLYAEYRLLKREEVINPFDSADKITMQRYKEILQKIDTTISDFLLAFQQYVQDQDTETTLDKTVLKKLETFLNPTNREPHDEDSPSSLHERLDLLASGELFNYSTLPSDLPTLQKVEKATDALENHHEELKIFLNSLSEDLYTRLNEHRKIREKVSSRLSELK